MALLQAVLQTLSRLKTSPPAIITPQQEDAESLKLLNELLERRQLLEVTPAGTNHSSQSLILAIDAARELLWIDDLFPTPSWLEPGHILQIQHQAGHERLIFDAPVLAWGAPFGASGIALPLPSQLSYQPRRRVPRWEIPRNQILNAWVRTLGQEPMRARVINLSAGGLRLALPGNQLAHLRLGTRLPLCELRLNARDLVRCRAQIKAVRLAREPYRHTQVSLEFLDLSDERQLALAHYVSEQCKIDNSVEQAA